MVIGGYRIKPLLSKTGKEIQEDGILGLSAQMAYYFFFSLFPLLLFVAPLLGLIGDRQETVRWLMDQIALTVPASAIALLSGVINDVVLSPGAPGVISMGALLALWAGSNVFNGLIDALNRALDIEEGRPWWKRRLIAIAAVIAGGIVLVVATTIMLAGPTVIDFIAGIVGLGSQAERLWSVFQYPAALTLLIGLAWLIYYLLPNTRAQSGWHVLIGAVVATLLWVGVTLLFRFYVQNFGNYNQTYGTIGGIIVLLLWMYLSMLVFLSTGELISELNHGTGSVRGRAGATYKGRLSTGDGPVRPSTERIERVEPLAARGPHD
ncbi:MAG: YihY/virulence factor BrkB family protein [Gemmatimonadaceae bacterium]